MGSDKTASPTSAPPLLTRVSFLDGGQVASGKHWVVAGCEPLGMWITKIRALKCWLDLSLL